MLSAIPAFLKKAHFLRGEVDRARFVLWPSKRSHAIDCQVAPINREGHIEGKNQTHGPVMRVTAHQNRSLMFSQLTKPKVVFSGTSWLPRCFGYADCGMSTNQTKATTETPFLAKPVTTFAGIVRQYMERQRCILQSPARSG